jgi:N-acetylglucosamine-6-sulfatase
MKTFAFVVALTLISSSVVAKPNIIVILTDDQDDTGSMAYMPKTISLIAKRGVTFKNSFVNFPLCAPSRVSWLTGQAAHNHGVHSDDWKKGGGWKAINSIEDNILPVWLKTAGYTTAFIGKYVNGYGNKPDSSVPVPPGWDSWFAINGFKGTDYFDYVINENRTARSFDHNPGDYSTDVLRDQAVKFIGEQSQANTPFFMLVATKAPHGAGSDAGVSTPAPRHAGLFVNIRLPESPAFDEEDVSDKPGWVRRLPRLDYAAMERFKRGYQTEIESLQAVDDLVEALVSSLERIGKLQDTIIVYSSDNGFIFGEHRLEGKTAGYEGSIRVPLLMTGPGIPENQTRDQLVNNLDVVATIEEAAGIEPGLIPDGRSLRPLFGEAEVAWRGAILIEGGHPARATRSSKNVEVNFSFDNLKRLLLGQEKKNISKEYFAVRTADYKYIVGKDGFEELYDLKSDPYELQNKASEAAYASKLTLLRKRLTDLKSCVGEVCWVSP